MADLVVGGGEVDRILEDAEELLSGYRTDDGLRYLDYQPVAPEDVLLPDDLAVTILINSRASSRTFKSVQDHHHDIDLASLPAKALEDTTPEERDRVAALVGQVGRWPGFACSIASKVLHKKRPALIPLLDNQAIFGAYMNPNWPQQRSLTASIYATSRIRKALDWIHTDLTRPQNTAAWRALQNAEPKRSRIQLFDMVWWTYFRRHEPVPRRPR